MSQTQGSELLIEILDFWDIAKTSWKREFNFSFLEYSGLEYCEVMDSHRNPFKCLQQLIFLNLNVSNMRVWALGELLKPFFEAGCSSRNTISWAGVQGIAKLRDEGGFPWKTQAATREMWLPGGFGIKLIFLCIFTLKCWSWTRSPGKTSSGRFGSNSCNSICLELPLMYLKMIKNLFIPFLSCHGHSFHQHLLQ